MSSPHYGIGIYEVGRHQACVNGKNTREYNLWTDMLRRCYDLKYQSRKPTYVGCEVSDKFKSFQSFIDWAIAQKGFHLKDSRIDKDLLFKGNKLYGEDTCVFVPERINAFLTHKRSNKGDFPVGVRFHSRDKKFTAACNDGQKHIWLGYHTDPICAFYAYKLCKEGIAKRLAIEYDGILDDRVISALNNFEVNIND